MIATAHDAPLDFALPPALEAREPAEARGAARDGVRLLVSDRRTGDVTHRTFRDLPQLLRAGDLLVANDSSTLPAALDATRVRDGRPLAFHLSSRVAATLWIAEPRGSVEAGDTLALPDHGTATVLAQADARSRRLWFVRVDTAEPIEEYLARHGRPIRYAYVERAVPLAAYQTIFGRTAGSAEMPSAGRPFTAATLEALRARRVELATVTLHAGVSSAERDEPPGVEPFSVPPATARAVRAARRDGRRVIAIGTTVVRALESATSDGEPIAASGWTDLVVGPERGLRVVDGLLTGLHEPRASHLQMLRALLDADALARAYGAALDAGYLWHEFGDVHLIA